ncbi:Uncharacterized protein dnm_046830 [Desulfonema magnum]|uniref:Uncharacterized protein n=1 Tax=Desulfonema magnum TaxID=45655 RepID=A0A975BN86_9BACT|nr:Uncharacterized protein dnm_046830 [Desulfonema magnum]
MFKESITKKLDHCILYEKGVKCQVSGVRKNYKFFMFRCDRQIMAVYMKKVLSVRCQVLGKITNFSCFVVTGRSWPFI